MNLFYNQPLSHRFGVSLNSILKDPEWNLLEIGVAWVRESGIEYLREQFEEFLAKGGVIRVSVGVDVENTSLEGLQSLLELERFGNIESYVYHNETQTIFHPKVYLFSNNKTAKLIVGSNNLTKSGLFLNTEAGLEINLSSSDQTIVDARAALASWRDPSLDLARKLTQDLLKDLLENNYILSEKTLNQRRQTSVKGDKKSEPKKTLFGKVHFSTPEYLKSKKRAVDGSTGSLPATGPVPAARPVPTAGSVPAAGPVSAAGPVPPAGPIPTAPISNTVLIMRVRKAHARTRPTQTQLPKGLVEEFFSGYHEIISSHDSRPHQINIAMARGIINTMKLEIPEMRVFNDPVVRFEKINGRMYYQAYDANAPLGESIMASLLSGLRMTPPATSATRPNDLDVSTMWRFI